MSFDDLARFKETYITECFELLRDMEEHLLALDVDEVDKETLNAIFRCAHSIKGGAGAFGFDRITKFTHVAEFLLDAMREGKVEASTEIVDALLKSVDVITQMVRAAQAGETLPDDFGNDLEQKLQSFASGGAAHAPKAAAKKPAQKTESNECSFYSIKFIPHANMMVSGNEPLLLLKELSGLGKTVIKADSSAVPALDAIEPDQCYVKWQIELESSKPESALREVFEFVDDSCDLEIDNFGGISMGEPEPAAETPASNTSDKHLVSAKTTVIETEAKAPAVSTIRVDLEKVDRLVNLVGELVITQSMISAQIRAFQPDQYPELSRGVDELSQHCRELQEAVMSVRMQPVKSIFSRMPRIVRDISQKLGKKIALEMSGEGTEVDKTVIEQLGDPLTHMIRNAVDHGVEMPDVRAAKGKDEEGTIHLTAFHQGGKIFIQITDDGAGINREKVLQLAKNKGLIAQDAQLSDNEIDNLIFMPGFSTAEQVTDISGRGVGMDVVRRNIEGMNGTVHIESTPGHGSVFTVALPLTLAILDGMVVGVGSEQYIIPIANILETMKPDSKNIHKIADGNDMLNVRGEFITLLYLNEIFAVPTESSANNGLVVLVESNQKKIGLVVDELIGQQQVVIKSLESNSDPILGVSGATILGDGHVSLILDVAQLQSMANATTRKHSTIDA